MQPEDADGPARAQRRRAGERGASSGSAGPGTGAGQATRGAVAPSSEGQRRLWQAGRTGWALLGIAVLVALVGYLASVLSLLVIPLVLALFPATLLVPVADRLKARGVPAAGAAALSIVGGILGIMLVVGAMVPLVIAEAPELAESASEGVQELQAFLEDDPLGVDIGGVDELLEMGREQLGEVGELAGEAAAAAGAAVETLIGLVLLFVVLFFYLKDGRRLAAGLAATAPARHRARVRASMDRAWETLGAYFRGQLLVALVDAIFIGVALLLLGIPLALPLAVLIFFGGLFPIVGAFITGALAVLVAMADAGLVMGLIVLGIVILVQQLESNVLEPIILGRAISLHPLVVLLSITAGSVVLGILGAFLAVPAAAIVARVVDLLRDEQSGDHEEGADDDRGAEGDEGDEGDEGTSATPSTREPEQEQHGHA